MNRMKKLVLFMLAIVLLAGAFSPSVLAAEQEIQATPALASPTAASAPAGPS